MIKKNYLKEVHENLKSKHQKITPEQSKKQSEMMFKLGEETHREHLEKSAGSLISAGETWVSKISLNDFLGEKMNVQKRYSINISRYLKNTNLLRLYKI